MSSTLITDAFNYGNQGATFSSPVDDLKISGNEAAGFNLLSDGPFNGSTHIRADLSIAALSVGFTFGGSTTLEAFDLNGDSIASALFDGNGGPFFLGVVSDTPIAYVVMEESFISVIGDFHFASVPEPATAGLLGLGALAMFRRGRRC